MAERKSWGPLGPETRDFERFAGSRPAFRKDLRPAFGPLFATLPTLFLSQRWSINFINLHKRPPKTYSEEV